MNIKKFVVNIAPVIGLLMLVIVFFVMGNVKGINVQYGLKSVFNQSVVVAVVATGAVFIYTLGSFDISLGASTAVSALLGGITYLKTENLMLAFVVCIGIAVLVALTDSVLASVFHLPVFVTTIAMLSVLNALVLLLITMGGTGSEVAVPMTAVKGMDTIGFKVVVLVMRNRSWTWSVLKHSLFTDPYKKYSFECRYGCDHCHSIRRYACFRWGEK